MQLLLGFKTHIIIGITVLYIMYRELCQDATNFVYVFWFINYKIQIDVLIINMSFIYKQVDNKHFRQQMFAIIVYIMTIYLFYFLFIYLSYIHIN